MTGKIGEVSDNELWLRCPECGDSQHDLSKAHFSINLTTFVYNCLRCGYSGRLGPKEVLDLISRPDLDLSFGIESWEDRQKREQDRSEEEDDEYPPYLKGAGSPRPSLLERFHYQQESQKGLLWDVFEMRHPKDKDLIGTQFRCGKKRIDFGELGYGWVGPDLKSSPENPLFLVEGPYDVVKPDYVCVFGLISKGKLTPLSGHTVVLVPDGDVWVKSDLLKGFIYLLEWLMNHRQIYLEGIVHIYDGKDPDEAGPKDQIFIHRNACKTYLKDYINSQIKENKF